MGIRRFAKILNKALDATLDTPIPKRVITHSIPSKYVLDILNGKWDGHIPNPSMAAWEIKNIDPTGYGDVLLLGDKNLLKNSTIYKSDGGTSAFRHNKELQDISDVYQISKRMNEIDDLMPVNVKHQWILTEPEFMNFKINTDIFPYAEIKRTIPTKVTDFRHAFIPRRRIELKNKFDEINFPYTEIDNEYDTRGLIEAIQNHVLRYPELEFNKGGKL